MYPDLRSILDSTEDARQAFKVTQQEDICEACRDIDFFSLVFTRNLNYDSALWNRDNRAPMHDFGSVTEVESKMANCRLCCWVMTRLRGNPRRKKILPDFRVELCSSPYFKVQLNTDHSGKTEAAFYMRKLDLNARPPMEKPNFILEWDITSYQICDSTIPSVADVSSDPAFGFQKEEDLRFGGRRIPPQIHLPLVGSWLRMCEQGHGNGCIKPPLGDMIKQLQNLRVIDIKLNCVVDVPVGCRYIALSYVWGRTNSLLLTENSYVAMHTAGFFEKNEVPNTIRDAMTVVEGCGERFLWVDALCIIQDDASDRTIQLGQMGYVYQQASFTIFATCSDHADTGLAGVKLGTRNVKQPQIGLGNFGLVSLMNEWGPEIDSSAWQKRAWTLQEGAFSRRGLFLTSKQMHWRCLKAHWCEETTRETTLFHDLGRSEDGWGRFSELQLALTPTTRSDPQFFYHMLSVYNFRQLTFQGDTLNAFAGITQAITDDTSLQFIWGLPAHQLSSALSWSLQKRGPMLTQNSDYRRNESLHQVRRHDGAVASVPFPSWSWAGWEMGYYVARIERPIDTDELQPEITFNNYNEDGKLNRISEQGMDGRVCTFEDRLTVLDQYSNFRNQWMERPNTIEGGQPPAMKSIADSSLWLNQLVFWTSCARVSFQLPLELPSSDYTEGGESIKSGDFGKQILSRGFYYERTIIESKPAGTAPIDVIRDFVIIGRSLGDPDWLNGLIVRWDDGKASRVGHGNVSEKNWIASKREWKLVALV